MRPPDWDEIARNAEDGPGPIITDLDAHRSDISVMVVAWIDAEGKTWYFDSCGADVTILGMLVALQDAYTRRINAGREDE